MDFTENKNGYFRTKLILGEGEGQQESFDLALSMDQYQVMIVGSQCDECDVPKKWTSFTSASTLQDSTTFFKTFTSNLRSDNDMELITF